MSVVLPPANIAIEQAKGQTVTFTFTAANTLGVAHPLTVPLDGSVLNPLYCNYAQMLSCNLKHAPSTMTGQCITLCWNGSPKVAYNGASPGTKSSTQELDRLFINPDFITSTTSPHYRPLGTTPTSSSGLQFWLGNEDGSDLLPSSTADAAFQLIVTVLIF